MANVITDLLGELAELNPAWLDTCVYDGDTYPSIIHAVEASKFDKKMRKAFQHGSGAVAKMGYARPYTDKQKEVLEQLLRERCAPGTKYAEMLAKTKGADIVYTNEAHRNWYGVCSCARCAETPHLNYVGEILVRIRDER